MMRLETEGMLAEHLFNLAQHERQVSLLEEKGDIYKVASNPNI